MNKNRRAGNLGRFYPAKATEIDQMIIHWNKVIEDNIKDKSLLLTKPKAIISPHAGYLFSGFTANIAHRILSNSKPKRVIVIGPSHHVYVKGISISDFETFDTPYGKLNIDESYIEKLKKSFNFSFEEEAHFLEHSTETQMPFIKKYLPNASVIEMIYGNINDLTLNEIIKDLLRDKENAVVISTDLSHFHNMEKAEKIDQNCLSGVANKNINILNESCEACGLTGLKAIVQASNDLKMKSKLLDYRTSADASGDKNKVVGYMSACFYE